jgi:hypothetical protein
MIKVAKHKKKEQKVGTGAYFLKKTKKEIGHYFSNLVFRK